MGKTKRAKATTKPDGDKVTLDDGNAGIGNKYRDRVKELRRVRASELNANPKNWRTHSEGQSLAMKGILSEVGWADAVLARETSGGLELIDGHLRKEIAPDELVPVLVLDVDESEADKILLTHDPLAELAEANTFQLEQLLESVEIDNEELDAMLAEMSEDIGITPPSFEPGSENDQGKLDELKPMNVCCPECSCVFDARTNGAK